MHRQSAIMISSRFLCDTQEAKVFSCALQMSLVATFFSHFFSWRRKNGRTGTLCILTNPERQACNFKNRPYDVKKYVLLFFWKCYQFDLVIITLFSKVMHMFSS